MSKPFSLQSPEKIAEEYGGNKQKIAHAAQMGIVDPTTAVLAGMFIDRIRSSAMMEQGQPPTVAQQVLGPPQQQAMPAPPAPPSSPPPGMGAPMAGPPPEQAPQPQGPMAGGMPQGPGMADGGLASLSVPDDMFDESYAEGGIVGYADGGLLDEDFFHRQEMAESGGNQAAVSPAGAFGVMQLMPGTARDPGFGVTPLRNNSEEENRRMGREYMHAMKRRYGDTRVALMAFNWGPGNVDKWIRLGKPAGMVPAETKNYVTKIMGDKNPPGGGAVHVAEKGPTPVNYKSPDIASMLMPKTQENMELLRQLAPQSSTARDAMVKSAQDAASPEALEKDRKRDMWEMLAQVGFGMASSNSPYFLQALATAAQAAIPGARESRKEREAKKREAIKVAAEAEGISNKEMRERVSDALTMAKEELGLKGKDADRQQEVEIQGMRSDTDRYVADRAYDKALATDDTPGGTGGDPKPLSNSVVTKRLHDLRIQADKAIKDALASDKMGNHRETERLLNAYGDVRNTYNALAKSNGMAELPKARAGQFTQYNTYVRTQGAHPSGKKTGSALDTTASNKYRQPRAATGPGKPNVLDWNDLP